MPARTRVLADHSQNAALFRYAIHGIARIDIEA